MWNGFFVDSVTSTLYFIFSSSLGYCWVIGFHRFSGTFFAYNDSTFLSQINTLPLHGQASSPWSPILWRSWMQCIECNVKLHSQITRKAPSKRFPLDSNRSSPRNYKTIYYSSAVGYRVSLRNDTIEKRSTVLIFTCEIAHKKKGSIKEKLCGVKPKNDLFAKASAKRANFAVKIFLRHSIEWFIRKQIKSRGSCFFYVATNGINYSPALCVGSGEINIQGSRLKANKSEGRKSLRWACVGQCGVNSIFDDSPFFHVNINGFLLIYFQQKKNTRIKNKHETRSERESSQWRENLSIL